MVGRSFGCFIHCMARLATAGQDSLIYAIPFCDSEVLPYAISMNNTPKL